MAIVLGHSTDNLGDEIQTLALLRWIGLGHELVDRDRLSGAAGRSGPLWLCGWFLHGDDWPPPIPANVIGFHGQVDSFSALLSGGSRDYLRECGPVGCRDTATQYVLGEAGVPTWLSGCVTLTLPSRPSGAIDPDGAPIILADVVRKPPLLDRTPTLVSHKAPPGATFVERLNRGLELLDLYRSAAFVVTSRLHAALPCVAMGTPVVFQLPAVPDTLRRCVDYFPLMAKLTWGGEDLRGWKPSANGPVLPASTARLREFLQSHSDTHPESHANPLALKLPGWFAESMGGP